jgi:3-hydroxyacyl-CoA dehydrogenase
MKIAVLGAGMVGRTIALDLAKDFDVTSFDVSAVSLAILKDINPKIKTEKKICNNIINMPIFFFPLI